MAGCVVLSGAMLLILSLLFMEPDWWLIAVIAVGSDAIIFAVILFFYVLAVKRYSLKYFKLGEEYERQLAEITPHFVSFDEELKRELIKDAKNTYRIFGTVLKMGDYYDKTLSREREKLAVLKKMVDDLIIAIDDGSGFEGFIACSDSGRYTYRRRGVDDEYIDDELDGWEILSLLRSEPFSNAWKYLVRKVFDLCDFTLKDFHVSEQYSASCVKAREEFAKFYSPALATFRDELVTLSAKFSASLNGVTE
ncbi:MAG: hypothetical protein MJ072_01885 [Clostridia bacterium]|nr:hypothetical protein [Clostridia bacterium]